MIKGGNGGWFGFEDGEETGDGEVAGDVVSNGGDMTAAMLKGWDVATFVEGIFVLTKIVFVGAKAGDSLASKPQIAPSVYKVQAQEQILLINICSRDSLNNHSL